MERPPFHDEEQDKMGMKTVLFIGLGCPVATQIQHVCTHGEFREQWEM